MTNIIIQARMSSTRLPGKILLPLGRDPILKLMVDRISKASLVNNVIIATTINHADDKIIEFCKRMGYNYFRGSENDVLGRVKACAEYYDTDVIIDLTSDCPLIDPNHINFLINNFQDNDFVSNNVIRSWPDGFDINVFTIDALRKIDKMVTNPLHRVHSGWNIFQHPGEFKIKNFVAPMLYHWPELGLTLDEKDDYKLFQRLYTEWNGNWNKSAEEIINFMKRNPRIVSINREVGRKIGGVSG